MTTISYKTKCALAIAIIFWASAYVGIRVGLTAFTPGCLALFRFLVASFCMFLIYLRLPSSRHKVSFKDGLYLLAIGAATLGTYHITLNMGELTVPSGIASFITMQMPVMTTIIAVAFLGERVNVYGVIGLIVSFMGVALIALGETSSISFGMGIIYVLISAIAGSVYTVLQKPFLKKYHAIEVTAYGIWGTALILLCYAPSLWHELPLSSHTSTLATIYLGIFPAAISYLAWNYALSAIPASRATNFMYAMPLLATAMGWVWLGEIPLWLSLVGGCVALVGVWIVNESYAKPEQPPIAQEQGA